MTAICFKSIFNYPSFSLFDLSHFLAVLFVTPSLLIAHFLWNAIPHSILQINQSPLFHRFFFILYFVLAFVLLLFAALVFFFVVYYAVCVEIFVVFMVILCTKINPPLNS